MSMAISHWVPARTVTAWSTCPYSGSSRSNLQPSAAHSGPRPEPVKESRAPEARELFTGTERSRRSVNGLSATSTVGSPRPFDNPAMSQRALSTNVGEEAPGRTAERATMWPEAGSNRTTMALATCDPRSGSSTEYSHPPPDTRPEN